MHYAKVLVPVMVIAGAAAAACSAGDNTGPASLAQASAEAKGQAKKNPPGNNGTVKIQEQGAPDEIPDNDPHVGCVFNIEFRGFDAGDLDATWTLDAHPPSGKGVNITGPNTVFIGEDAAGGAPDLDALVTVNVADYDLSALVEHPIQGYHVKLTVHAEGSQGADTKHKVFWVKCGAPAPAPDAGSSSGGSSSGGSSSGGSSSGGSSSGGSSSGGTSGSSGKTW